jgi:hypothetical protein
MERLPCPTRPIDAIVHADRESVKADNTASATRARVERKVKRSGGVATCRAIIQAILAPRGLGGGPNVDTSRTSWRLNFGQISNSSFFSLLGESTLEKR